MTTPPATITTVPDTTQLLARYDLDWHRIDRLAWKALKDAKQQRGITLDADRDEYAHDFLMKTALNWLPRYDPQKANGVSFATSAYKRMVIRFSDYLRAEHGDQRKGTPIHTTPVATMPDAAIDQDAFSSALIALEGGLTETQRWTLHNLAAPIAAFGWPLRKVAEHAGITYEHAATRMADLADALRDDFPNLPALEQTTDTPTDRSVAA